VNVSMPVTICCRVEMTDADKEELLDRDLGRMGMGKDAKFMSRDTKEILVGTNRSIATKLALVKTTLDFETTTGGICEATATCPVCGKTESYVAQISILTSDLRKRWRKKGPLLIAIGMLLFAISAFISHLANSEPDKANVVAIVAVCVFMVTGLGFCAVGLLMFASTFGKLGARGSKIKFQFDPKHPVYDRDAMCGEYAPEHHKFIRQKLFLPLS